MPAPAAPRPAVSAAVLAACGAALWAAVELPGRAARADLLAETRAAETALSKGAARAHEVEMLLGDLADAPRPPRRRRRPQRRPRPPRHPRPRRGPGRRSRRLPHPPRPRPAPGRTGRTGSGRFAVSLEAPAAGFQAFLADLEAGRPLAEVTRLTLAPKDPAAGENGPVRLRGELEFVVYAAPARR